MLMWGVGKDEMKGKHDLSTTVTLSRFKPNITVTTSDVGL